MSGDVPRNHLDKELCAQFLQNLKGVVPTDRICNFGRQIPGNILAFADTILLVTFTASQTGPNASRR
jgi:hypothetical protein